MEKKEGEYFFFNLPMLVGYHWKELCKQDTKLFLNIFFVIY